MEDRTYEQWADVSLVAQASGLFNCDESWWLPPRSRPHYQLWVVTHGELDFRMGAGPVQRIGEHSTIMIPPETEQWGTFVAAPLRTYVVHFMAYDHGIPRTRLFPAQYTHDVPASSWRRIEQDAAELTRELDHRRRTGRLIANAALTDALARVVELPAQASEPVADELRSDVVADAITYVREHVEEDLSTPRLAALFHLSEESLRQLFKRATGQTPGQFVRQHRIGVAKHLLLESDHSVARIARETGYADAFYFSRLFTTMEGTAPSHFRKFSREQLLDGPGASRTKPRR